MSFVVPLVMPALGRAQGPSAPGGPSESVGVPMDGPAIPTPRILQADIAGGAYTLYQLRRRGLEMFTTPFNKYDGHGDGLTGPDPTAFGQRPTVNGTWLRVNGLDSQTCQECHAFVSMATIPPRLGIGGVAGMANSAFPFVTQFDIADLDASGRAEVNGRLINPPFLFGAGGVELAGKEMTRDLQALKAQAQANPGTPVALVTKGVSFGTLSYDTTTGFDLSGVEGIDDDLVVRPFGRKGEFASVRAFDVGALQFHMGMQAEELVGSGVDDDGDGVVDEVLIGELSAMHVFGTTLERPVQVAERDPIVQAGAARFEAVGCAGCHVPVLETWSRNLDLAYPEVDVDPSANVYATIDLTRKAPGFDLNAWGGVSVPLHSDLKRHDMGPELAETTGSAADPFFITPRLWGVSDTAPYLHDGRAPTLREAILAHGGEGQPAADAFSALSSQDQDALLTYLDSLRTPSHPASGIDLPVRNY
jgi:hypothetical protein